MWKYAVQGAPDGTWGGCAPRDQAKRGRLKIRNRKCVGFRERFWRVENLSPCYEFFLEVRNNIFSPNPSFSRVA